jgi:hypothetical protein
MISSMLLDLFRQAGLFFWASRKFKHKDALIDFSTFPGSLSTSPYSLCAFSSAGMQPLFLEVAERSSLLLISSRFSSSGEL